MAAGQSGELPQKVLGDASPISELQSEATYREQEAGGGKDSPLLIIPVAGKEVQTGTPEMLESWGDTKQQQRRGSAASGGCGQKCDPEVCNGVC